MSDSKSQNDAVISEELRIENNNRIYNFDLIIRDLQLFVNMLVYVMIYKTRFVE